MAFVNRRPSLSDLKQRGFRGELPTLAGNPTYKDIGKAAMVCTAIEQAYANDVSGASADPTTLGKAHAWTSSITNRVNALAADADAPATIQGVLNQIHEKLTVMQADTAKIQVIQADMVKIQADIVKIQADIVKIQADTAKIPEINTRFETAEKTIKDLTKTLGLLLTPVSKDHNNRCQLGNNFVPLPYKDGTFPDEATIALLSSRESIGKLTVAQLTPILTKYKLEMPVRLTAASLRKTLLAFLGDPASA